MTRWIRYAEAGVPGFGTLDGTEIRVHTGDMFGPPQPTGRTLINSKTAQALGLTISQSLLLRADEVIR